MIDWIEQQQFWEIFDSEYKPLKRYLNEVAYINCDLSEISELAKTEPVDTPADERDFAGPVLRWYTRIDGNLVLITFYKGAEPSVHLEFEDDDKSEVLETVFSEFKALSFDPSST
jgi:hypothetical protein